MDFFQYKDGQGYCEDVSLSEIAEKVGTPAYVYSRATLHRHLMRIKDAFSGYPTLACFAVKANSNLAVLKDIFKQGFGADLVSGGELSRSLLAGVDPKRVVFSGVGKKDEEIRQALEVGILSFNVESPFELESIAWIAKQMGKQAAVSLRVNPNIDAKTNPKIATGLFSTKFGMVESQVLELVKDIKATDSISLAGIACHIGSQITSLEPISEAAQRMADLALRIKGMGHQLSFIDMGGGLGIRYKDENAPALEEYAAVLTDAVRKTDLKLVIEPGRVLVGNIGILLSRVIGIKQTPQKKFMIVDGAMNDVIRPSLYDSYHEILPVKELREGQGQAQADVVGPICETGDFLGKNRELPLLGTDDLIFLRGCGAYSASMASNYNSRPRSPEIMVDGDQMFVVKPREKLENLWAGENLQLPEYKK